MGRQGLANLANLADLYDRSKRLMNKQWWIQSSYRLELVVCITYSHVFVALAVFHFELLLIDTDENIIYFYWTRGISRSRRLREEIMCISTKHYFP